MKNQINVMNHTELCAHHHLELIPMTAVWLYLVTATYVAGLHKLPLVPSHILATTALLDGHRPPFI